MDRSAGLFKGAVLDGNTQVVSRSSECRIGVKLRNTQHEQMSSAPPPRTDVGLARPKTLRGSRRAKHLVAFEGLSAIGQAATKVPPPLRQERSSRSSGLSVEQTFEFEALDELAPLHENDLLSCFLGDVFRSLL
jgi:hypothetical protein